MMACSVTGDGYKGTGDRAGTHATRRAHERAAARRSSHHRGMAAQEPIDVAAAHRCALNRTVVASVIGPGALRTALPLARSARDAGFPCVVVLPFGNVNATANDHSDLLLLLPSLAVPLLPRSQWCRTTWRDYILRRTQLYRMMLWRNLVELGFDVLGVDTSRRIRRNPLPALVALRTRDEEQYGSGAAPDVIGHTPGFYLKQYSFATPIWIRSTEATRTLLRRAAARSFGALDELVFTEELNWGAGAGAICCHSSCLALHFTSSPVVHPIPTPHSTTCATNETRLPLAPPPPNATRHVWPTKTKLKAKTGAVASGPWRPGEYNSLAIPLHRFGRCTGRDGSCVGLHPSCPPPPPPFTRQTSLEMRKADEKKARERGAKHRAERAKRRGVAVGRQSQ